MPSTISINTLPDSEEGVSSFLVRSVTDVTLVNNLIRCSTLKKVLNDPNFGSILSDGSIPAEKLRGLVVNPSDVATMSLSGAIGASLSPARNGQLAWYTITPQNMAWNTFAWTPDGKFDVSGELNVSKSAAFGQSNNAGSTIFIKGYASGDINQGAQIIMENTAPGVTTPKKAIRIGASGNLQVLSNDYSTPLINLNDNGNLTVYSLVVNGTINATGDITAFYNASDINLKENIKTIENSLHKVEQLRGVNFTFKDSKKESTGLIAQDLEKILPQAVYENEHGVKHIRYEITVGLLVEAIKELSEKIKVLESKLN